MRARLLKTITVATFAHAHCFVVMVLRRCIACALHKWQKYLLHAQKLFYYEYFIPEKTKEMKKHRFVQQKAYALYSVDPHFVSSTLNIHQYHR